MMARACPVCGYAESTRKYRARDPHYGIPGEWWIRECSACDSFLLEELPTQEELASLYAETYYAYCIRPSSRTRRMLRRLLMYSTRTGEPVFDRPGRMLDFGCGAGEFLLEMRERGWQCAGVEISAVARARARSLGLDVRSSLLGSDGFEPASFNYIRANHSLEHVPAPAQTLKDMHALLKPGGRLFVGVPTNTSQSARVFGAAWWHLTPPLHTFVPSTHGMRQLVERSGFTVSQLSTNGDYAGTAGSLQILLNRGTARRSNEGLVFRLRPLLLLGHWAAKAQDLFGVGDKLELIATRQS